jgi:multidrug efflux pump subunit AcrB
MLTGAARYLFTPLALAVVFAMLASYALSRTLVPNMVHYMLRPEMKLYIAGEHAHGGTGIFWTVHNRFNRQFERLRAFYSSLLEWALDHKSLVLGAFAVFVICSGSLLRFIGSDFFPTVDSGQIRLHARAPAGTRIEQTEVVFAQLDDTVREVIPQREIDTIIDNIGIPQGSTNMAYGDNPTIGPGDGEILISLKGERGQTTPEYVKRLRRRLNERFPDVTFYFEAANITNQILNFGLPAPIDLQVVGRNADVNFAWAQRLERMLARIPGAVDVHVHQVMNYPEIRLNVDRDKAGLAGLTQRDVSNSLMISLSGSGQVAPNQWLNIANGVQYGVSVQTPQRTIDSLPVLLSTPIAPVAGTFASVNAGSATGASPNQATLAYGNPGAGPESTQQLSNLLSSAERGAGPQIVNHYNVQPVFDVYANVEGTDLGTVGTAVEKIMAEQQKNLPRGTTLDLHGQITTMESSFYRLGIGLVFAILLVYFLMALNFQSWLDPFIILMALPGALAGILWMLFVTQTTFSVPSLMGSIMCIGVATANSILLVVFANDQRLEGMDGRAAALSAGQTRIRPVLMTAAAMIMGMLPMALGMGEGGEQNAPLGRAVIGGLALATVTTLLIVPLVYSLLRRKSPVNFDDKLEEEEREDVSVYLNA